MSETRLVCLPFAGAGAGLFRQWHERVGGRVSLVPLQLPGREELFSDAPLVTMDALVDFVTAKISRTVGKCPFALFGHSFGALVAYEVAQELVASGLPRPATLVVSGAASPWVARPRLDLASITDAEFIARLSELVGYVHPALADPGLREVLLPALRADMAIVGDYRPSSRSPLPIPITVLRGSEDQLVSDRDVSGWAEVGAANVEFIRFPGPHMYFVDDPEALLVELERIVARSADLKPDVGVSGTTMSG
ncbi:thioesterase II family protein [Amycolatopsis keratiniphila]|uniref:Thioesterase n=1 Tax=Amycolatopsis keratiniphila TaxID=129921 RepID=R4T6E0_9PSEU|nr:alpha/beta fold hydrolase [Amycolatopsis keratiniphila]AGM07931.1 thioesterase [Amycolatopsis keratiniphila]